MTEDQVRFDFAAWLNQSPTRHSFRDCLRAAVDSLALDDGNLRERIAGAIFCLRLCREQDVPDHWRREVRAALEAVKLRGEDGELHGSADLDYRELWQWAQRCKLRTARRIARTIMRIHWGMDIQQ